MIAKIRLLGYIYIALSGTYLLAGLALCVPLLLSRDVKSVKALQFIGPFFLLFAVVYFVPGLIAGIGLLNARPWARVVIIGLAVLMILLFPFGTALGGFGLWVLLSGEAKLHFGARAAEDRPPPAVAPSL